MIEEKELRVMNANCGEFGYWKNNQGTYTALCLMSPTAKYFVGNKYKTLTEAKRAFIQKQEHWNEKNRKEGMRTCDYETLISDNEKEG